MDTSRKILVLASLFLLVLSCTAVAQDRAPIEELKLSLGETRSFNINLKNPLPMDDSIYLSFSGQAYTDGYVVINLSSDDIAEGNIKRDVDSLDDCSEDSHCCNGDLECVIRMGPGEEKNINYTARATLAGQVEQADLIVDAKSDETQLSGTDKITISTRPVDQGEPVSAPALTTPYIIMTGLGATIFYMFYKS